METMGDLVGCLKNDPLLESYMSEINNPGRARTGERPSPKRSLHPQRSSGHCGARVASGHYERGAWCG